MIKQILALLRKKYNKHSTHDAWLRYCVENPGALGCRIYDV